MKKVLFALVAMSLLFTACEDGNDDYIKLKEVDDVCTMMDDLRLMENCYEKFDVNKDGKVSMSEAAAATDISVYIDKSIKGLEYFINLTDLKISFYEGRTMDLDFSPFKNLRTLSLRNRYGLSEKPININLRNNKALEKLEIGLLTIPQLDLSKCKGLTEITLSEAAVNNLNLANGNEILAGLYWDRFDISSPTLTIWLKSGQVLKEGLYNRGYKYTIKYID